MSNAATCGPDKTLAELHAGGFTALASEVPELRPQSNQATPGVLDLQQRYVRVPSSPLTTTFSGSVATSAPLPAPPGSTVPVVVTFDIVQAPAAFSLPVMQKRPWEPPFQVRMTWRSTLPLQFSTTVAAFMVDESALPSMLSWQLPAAEEAGKQLLEHQQERMIALAPVSAKLADRGGGPGSSEAAAASGAVGGSSLDQALPPLVSPQQEQQGPQQQLVVAPLPSMPSGQQEHFAEAVFTFNRLQFGAPSQMRPRWLVFAASLVGGGCVYSHYKVPTVVMSRLADQFEKAKAVLWGSAQPSNCDSRVMKMDYRQLRKYIKRELLGVGVTRDPSEEDYRYLASRAGFVVAGPTGVRATSATLEELEAFKQWFGGHTVMLKHIRSHFERTDPQVICGFGTTREQAAALLAPHPPGTFLLRFGSQGGLLVLSVRTGGSSPSSGGASCRPDPAIAHYSISRTELQRRGLEALLERNGKALKLLDAATGQCYDRTAVLDRSYLQAVDVAAVRKRYRVRAEDEAESPPDPPSSLAAFQTMPADDPPGEAQEGAPTEGPPMLGAPSGPLQSMSSETLLGAPGASRGRPPAGGGAKPRVQQQREGRRLRERPGQSCQQLQQLAGQGPRAAASSPQKKQEQQEQRQRGVGQLGAPPMLAVAGSGTLPSSAAAAAIAAVAHASEAGAGSAAGVGAGSARDFDDLLAAAAAYNPYCAASMLQRPPPSPAAGAAAVAAALGSGLHAWASQPAAAVSAPLPTLMTQQQQQQQMQQQQMQQEQQMQMLLELDIDMAAAAAAAALHAPKVFKWNSPGLLATLLSAPDGAGSDSAHGAHELAGLAAPQPLHWGPGAEAGFLGGALACLPHLMSSAAVPSAVLASAAAEQGTGGGSGSDACRPSAPQSGASSASGSASRSRGSDSLSLGAPSGARGAGSQAQRQGQQEKSAGAADSAPLSGASHSGSGPGCGLPRLRQPTLPGQPSGQVRHGETEAAACLGSSSEPGLDGGWMRGNSTQLNTPQLLPAQGAQPQQQPQQQQSWLQLGNGTAGHHLINVQHSVGTAGASWAAAPPRFSFQPSTVDPEHFKAPSPEGDVDGIKAEDFLS